MTFQWDASKARLNERKHSVTFREAATIFGDPLALTFSDPDHSTSEERELTFGRSVSDKYIVVAHTDREEQIRIISAREMTARERRLYEYGI